MIKFVVLLLSAGLVLAVFLTAATMIGAFLYIVYLCLTGILA